MRGFHEEHEEPQRDTKECNEEGNRRFRRFWQIRGRLPPAGLPVYFRSQRGTEGFTEEHKASTMLGGGPCVFARHTSGPGAWWHGGLRTPRFGLGKRRLRRLEQIKGVLAHAGRMSGSLAASPGARLPRAPESPESPALLMGGSGRVSAPPIGQSANQPVQAQSAKPSTAICAPIYNKV